MKVIDIYTPAVVHIPMSCNLRDASIQMRDQHVGALIATSGEPGNCIAGIVTDRDIVLQAGVSGASLNDMLVADAMTPHVVAIAADADLTDAMQTMSSHGVRRLAVTNAEQDIVGVLSLDDVIEAIGRDLVLLSSIIRCDQNRESLGCVQAPLHI